MTDFDYSSIPEFQENIKHLKAMEASDDERIQRVASNILWFTQHKKLQLTVEITDPYLAACGLELSGMGGSMPGLPGMELTEIRFADLAGKDVLIKWLEGQIAELRNS